MTDAKRSSEPTPQPVSGSRSLPPRPSLEHLKHQAKARLAELRRENRRVKLTDAQFAVAREYGFSSWRALKAHVETLHASRSEAQLTQFFEALGEHDLPLVKSMLHADPTLAYADPPGGRMRPIMLAASAERHGAEPGLVDLLLEHRMPITLHEAAAIGKTSVVAAILERSPQALDEADETGMTPLLWAVSGGRTDVAAYLLYRGANPNAQPSAGGTPLHFAVGRGDRKLVEALLAHGADPTIRCQDALLPAHVAAIHGQHEIVDLLLAHGTPMDAWLPAALGKRDLLAQLATNPNARLTADGPSLVEIAAAARQHDIVDWLIERGAGIDAWSAVQLGHHGYIRQRAAADPAWLNGSDRRGMTALHQAVARCDRGAVKLLLDSGARTDLVDHRQRTPRQWADPVRDSKIVEMLSDTDD